MQINGQTSACMDVHGRARRVGWCNSTEETKTTTSRRTSVQPVICERYWGGEYETVRRTLPSASSAPSKKRRTPRNMKSPPNDVSATPISAHGSATVSTPVLYKR